MIVRSKVNSQIRGEKHNSRKGTAMSLNIKNEETTRMVRELAALKGVSLVGAVSEAVKEKLEREKAERDRVKEIRKSRYDLLMDFADEYSKGVQNPIHSWEIDAELYGEDGLPK
jgi:antitoxin VapB